MIMNNPHTPDHRPDQPRTPSPEDLASAMFGAGVQAPLLGISSHILKISSNPTPPNTPPEELYQGLPLKIETLQQIESMDCELFNGAVSVGGDWLGTRINLQLVGKKTVLEPGAVDEILQAVHDAYEMPSDAGTTKNGGAGLYIFPCTRHGPWEDPEETPKITDQHVFMSGMAITFNADNRMDSTPPIQPTCYLVETVVPRPLYEKHHLGFIQVIKEIVLDVVKLNDPHFRGGVEKIGEDSFLPPHE